jgi:hypothetical protein
MRSIRAALPLALAVGLVAVAPAVADAKSSPPAKASGGDVVTLVYPSLVKTRVARAHRALDRAGRKIDNGQGTLAAAALKVVRRQSAAAWRGAKYIIRTTPPPPPADDAAFRPNAHASGGAPVGPTLAAPADTAVLVLGLLHDVSSEMIQQTDGAHGTGLNAIATTLNWSDDKRDSAIQYIFSVAPPAPPADDAAFRPQARKSGGAPVVTTFDTVMPNLIPQFDDETQGIEGLKSDATDLTSGGRRLLNAAETQIEKTRAFVNTTWPPVVPED